VKAAVERVVPAPGMVRLAPVPRLGSAAVPFAAVGFAMAQVGKVVEDVALPFAVKADPAAIRTTESRTRCQ